MARSLLMLALLAMLGAAAPAAAQNIQPVSDEDAVAITATALNYIEGWYEGDAGRMGAALHPDLVKRIVVTAPPGVSALNTMTSFELVASTGRGGGSDTPPEERHTDVTILDVYENAASVRIYASGWVDYLQMARWNGEWKIVNVLWEQHAAQ